MSPRLALLVIVLFSLAGCHRSARRMVAKAGPDEQASQGRLIALGATVVQPFFATNDGCLKSGSGKLDLRIDCIPNFGTPTVDEVSIDDPTVIELSPEKLPAGPQPGPVYRLKALHVGTTVLRAKAHVGLTASRFVIPLEVVVPDRVTVGGLDELIYGSHAPAAEVHVLSRGREVETGDLQFLTIDGPAALEGFRLRTVEDRGGSGFIRSPLDASLAAPYTVVTEADLQATLEVLPAQGCSERRVVPHFFVRGRELRVDAKVVFSGQLGLKPQLFVITPKTCELDSHGTFEVPRQVGPEGGVVRLKGGGACRVQLGVARFHNGAAFGALAETSFSPGPCATR